jgi:hypothetical protein
LKILDASAKQHLIQIFSTALRQSHPLVCFLETHARIQLRQKSLLLLQPVLSGKNLSLLLLSVDQQLLLDKKCINVDLSPDNDSFGNSLKFLGNKMQSYWNPKNFVKLYYI